MSWGCGEKSRCGGVAGVTVTSWRPRSPAAGPSARSRSSRPAGKAGAKKAIEKPARRSRRGSGGGPDPAPRARHRRARARACSCSALLTGLALATDLTGPLGRALGDGITALLGNGAFLVPLALLAVAGPAAGGADPTTRRRGAAARRASASSSSCSPSPVSCTSSAARPTSRTRSTRCATPVATSVASSALPLDRGLGTVGASIVLIALLGFGRLLASGHVGAAR